MDILIDLLQTKNAKTGSELSLGFFFPCLFFGLVQVSLSAKQLMYRLLHRDPKNRLGSREGANEIKRHPFFRGVNWALVRCMVILQTLNGALFLKSQLKGLLNSGGQGENKGLKFMILEMLLY